MKTILGVITACIILISCTDSKGGRNKNYIESQPTFFELRHDSWIKNTWIREPKNLLKIHETFKKFGYSKLISQNLLIENTVILNGIYINKQFNHWLDSLELSYNSVYIQDKYYKEFWQRRKNEKNDSMVYQIIKDVNSAIKHKQSSANMSLNADNNLVNDTLLSLLKIESHQNDLIGRLAQKDFETLWLLGFYQSEYKVVAHKNFETLRRLGFHQSAYNLLFERYAYQDFDWNADSLETTLQQTDIYIEPWFADDTK